MPVRQFQVKLFLSPLWAEVWATSQSETNKQNILCSLSEMPRIDCAREEGGVLGGGRGLHHNLGSTVKSGNKVLCCHIDVQLLYSWTNYAAATVQCSVFCDLCTSTQQSHAEGTQTPPLHTATIARQIRTKIYIFQAGSGSKVDTKVFI